MRSTIQIAQTFAAALVLFGISIRFSLADDPPAPAPAPAAHATPAQIQQTIERGIGYVQTESGHWMKTRKCASCHHAAMAIWSLSEIDRLGYTIDKQFVADMAETIIGNPQKMIDSRLVPGPNDPPDTRPLASGVRTATVFMSVAGHALPSLTDGQKQSLQQINRHILEKQQSDGSWEFFLSRPPVNENQTTDHVWILMALQGQIGPDSPPEQRAALEKGIAWLAAAKLPDTTQDKALKLLMAVRAGKSHDELQPDIDQLRRLQRPDGGWAQLPTTTSDAFATGQTLYILALAGEPVDRVEMRRAIDFLVSTQKPDGSWPMTSRSSPDGSTGGSAKLLTPITCASSAWATLALARIAPK